MLGLFFSSSGWSQNYMRALGTPGDDEGASTIVKGPFGDYYLGGYSENDGMVTRVSPEGEVIWMKTIDFGADPNYIMHLRLTTDNYIIGCGNARTGGGNNPYGFVFKMDLSGAVIWTRRFVCDDLYLWTNSLVESSNGNYRVIGSYKNTKLDNYAVEYDAVTGVAVWDSIYAKTTIDNSFDESFYDIVSHPTNNADYIGGRFQLGGGLGTYRPSLTKINADGSYAWSKTYVYNNSPSGGRYYCFSIDADDDSLIMGLFCKDGATGTPFETGLVKTDLDGDISWAKLYSSPGNDLRCYNMTAIPGGYLLAGWIETADKALFLIRTNTLGEVIWAKEYSAGGIEDVYLASSNSRVIVDGDYVLTVGRTNAFSGSFDALLVKADLSTGELMDGSCNDDLIIVESTLPSYQEDYPMVVETLPITVSDPAMPVSDVVIDDSGLLVEAVTDTTVGGDTLIICDGETVGLLADWDPSLDFLWSTGETTNEITVAESGTYWVNVMVGGDCVIFSDTVTIILDDAFFDLGPDLTICDASEILLDPGFFADATYEWQDGSTDQTLLVDSDGLYWVTVDAEFCSHTDSINVLFDILDVYLGADTMLCEGEILVLDAENPGAIYEWNDGSTDQTLTVTEPGTYWVLVDNGICDNADSINVSFSSVSVDLGNDTTLCTTGTLLLDAGPGFSYLWNDGATTQTITVTTAGAYSVTITDGVCSSYDEIEVDYSAPVCNFVGNPLNGCIPLTVDYTDLSIADGGTVTSWYWTFGDGSISTDPNPSHIYTAAGTFDVSLTITTDNGCTASQTFVAYINTTEGAIAGFLVSPDFISTETVVNFTNTSLNATSWAWTFGDGTGSNNENPEHVFNGPGEYTVTLIAYNENGCHDTITKTIIVKEDIFIYVPNVFTPDGDNFNEIWKPYIYGIDIYDFHLTLFNRWGEIIWESYNSNTGWNGTYGDALVQDGVYVWTIEYGDKWTDERKTITGHVTILK